MLYSIIPPILIVASLIGIIILLMRKSKEVALLPPKEISNDNAETMREAGFFGKKLGFMKKINGNSIKHFLLAISEKITRKLRVLFLKLESKSANLSNTIREKRKLRFKKPNQATVFQRENDIIKKVEDYKIEKETTPIIEKIHKEEPVRPADEEKEIKPIISERVVTPRMKTEIRDRLEELLIERIAVNPKDIEAYERLGEYYLEIKSYTDSKECFKQVLKLDPKNKNARYRMKRLENLLARG